MSKDKRGRTLFASSLPQCSEPNQRVHMDLFGPLKTLPSQKKFILCITDAFSKYVELVAIQDKSAPTVASALYSRWLCRHGLPLEIVSDKNSVMKLWTLFETNGYQENKYNTLSTTNKCTRCLLTTPVTTEV
jgi:hypothetical protein